MIGQVELKPCDICKTLCACKGACHGSPIAGDSSPVLRPSSSVLRPSSILLRPSSSVLRLTSFLTVLLLLFAVTFNLIVLYPEVAIKAPMYNNGVLHFLALERMVSAWQSGQVAIDLWLPTIALGFPLFHYYQHLPYVVQTAVFQLLSTSISLLDLFRWTNYLLLSFFPLSIYWSMRRFGFERLTSAMSGLVASLLATNGLYGFELSSYIWSGNGLYTQLWGMFLLPLALAQGTSYMRKGHRILPAALLLAAVVLSHLVLGYMAFVSLAALLFLPLLSPPNDKKRRLILWQRGKRLLSLFLLVALLTAYFWLPFVLDSPYMNRSVWDEAAGLGTNDMRWTLTALAKGDLFDYGRFPSLTLLTAAGLVICFRHWRDERYRIPVVLSLLWLLLYFVRPTWGVMLDMLPLNSALNLHRFIAGIHLGGIFLMGIALALPWQWALTKNKLNAVLAAAILTLLLLFPLYRERGVYLAQNEQLIMESKTAFDREKADIDTLLTTLASLPPGRVYAGNDANWGKDYTIGAVPLYALLQSAGLDMVGHLYHTLSLNADIQARFDENQFDHYELFNVRYVVAPPDHPFPEFVHHIVTAGRHSLYQVHTSGYLELVSSKRTIAINPDQFYPTALRWFNSDQPAKKEHPILIMQGTLAAFERQLSLQEECGSGSTTQAPDHPNSHVISENIEQDVYTALVHVENPGCLMLKSTYNPNWRATVDGHEVETAMVLPAYVSVKIGSGTHTVQFEYAPRTLSSWSSGLSQLGNVKLAP